MTRRGSRLGFLFAVPGLLAAAVPAAGEGSPNWLMSGQNAHNNRNQPMEKTIDAGNARDLRCKWKIEGYGQVFSTPAVDGDTIYLPTMASVHNETTYRLLKINAADGTVLKALDLSTLQPKTVQKAPWVFGTPAVTDDLVILSIRNFPPQVVALDKDLELVWVTGNLDATGHYSTDSILTAAPVVHDGVIYQGITSGEEANIDKCCHFRGQVVALEAATGKLIWRTFLTPEGYNGATVWGSTPVVDTKLGRLYVATGDNYELNPEVLACLKRHEGLSSDHCFDNPDNHIDSVVALDLADGSVVWSFKTRLFDAWNKDCTIPFLPGKKCPMAPHHVGPDFDFAQGPTLIEFPDGHRLLGAGQKSGVYWGFDPDGTDPQDPIWHTKVGPGSAEGGMEFGSATDGERIYVANNSSHWIDVRLFKDNFRLALHPWVLQPEEKYDGQKTTKGFWSALDARTGEIRWQTVAPNQNPRLTGNVGIGGIRAGLPTWVRGPVSVANGVVYGGVEGPTEADGDYYSMVALDAENGDILWKFKSGGEVSYAGAAIVDGTVYWGDESLNTPGPDGQGRFFAFSVPPTGTPPGDVGDCYQTQGSN